MRLDTQNDYGLYSQAGVTPKIIVTATNKCPKYNTF